MKSDFFSIHLNKNDLVAAPLAGISMLPFRRLLRRFFNGLIYSEMVSCEGISRRNAESMEYLDRGEGEYPLVFQLFGGRAESFSEAVKVAEDSIETDAFDINAGCPVKKVLKAGGGCALLSDTERLKEIVKSVRKATEKPFSIKIRIGLNKDTLVYKEIIDIAQGEGADAVIIHARTKSDMFGGDVRLDCLAEAAEMAEIPIIGNGSISSYDAYINMKKTGVAGVMIGRAMMKSPWIFESIRKEKQVQGYFSPLQLYDILTLLWGYMQEHAQIRPKKRTHYMHVLRKFAVWFSSGLEDAASFRTNIYKINNECEILKLIENFFRT